MDISVVKTLTTSQQVIDRSDELLQLGRMLYEDREYRDALDLSRVLEPLVAEIPESLPVRQQLQGMINRLRCLALHLLPERLLFQVFETALATGLQDSEWPSIERLRYRLTDVPLEKRDDFRRSLMRYLERNQQILTQKNLSIAGRVVPGTVANWLQDYRQKIGGDQVGLLDLAQYMTSDQNIKSLSAADKAVVQRLIDLVEYLKLSSYSPEGFEESVLFTDTDGALKLWENGQGYILSEPTKLPKLQPVAADTKKTSTTPSAVVAVREQPVLAPVENVPTAEVLADATVPTVQPKASTVKKMDSMDVASLRQAFYTAVQKKSLQEFLAVMQTMIEKQDFFDFLSQDKKLNAFMVNALTEAYGASAAAAFKQDPRSPSSLKVFLRYILEKRLEVSESEAAKIGLYVANLFVRQGKKEYTTIAYYDVRTKKFSWLQFGTLSTSQFAKH